MAIYKLKDICLKIGSGATPKGGKEAYCDEGISLIRSQNVLDFTFSYDGLAHINDQQAEKLSNVEVKPQDILLNITGDSVARVCTVDPRALPARVNQHVAIIRPDENRVLSSYILYFLQMIKPYLLQIAAGGATRNALTKSMIENLELEVPDILSQKKIVSVLDDIQGKIRDNNEINKNLSDLLQAIYQKQFGEVSLGANQGILSDICSYSKEKVAVSELNVNTYFSTENMLPEKAGSTKATSLPTTLQTTACRKGDTLISNIRPYFKKIVYCEDMCGCSTDVLCFTPVQSQYAAYLFSTLYTDKFFAFMVAGSKGTKMPRGDKQQIMTYPVILPAENELEEFNAIAFPVLEQLNSNKAENKRLSALRDALLPKLMSGELDVSDIDL
ncbi:MULTISPECIES: restriction endonuclease subunit S [Lachnospiraceae]|jgi:type I restriction enzyme S subunit|uniref:restriction endonuclease subunit S n=2 Tax=Lachnospirales TaxID=3085636 RepID=UPI001571452C|nr:restriction endonuclease subunit S [Faecalicatena fissicatena]NSE55146.1 restriction endonuclease subunit S [Faecalicatena fissicatena]